MTNSSQSSKAYCTWSYWFFVGLIAASAVYLLGLLALQLSAPADGYSAGLDQLSPEGFTISSVLIERDDGLQVGDVIISAGERTVEEWLALAFRAPLGTVGRWQAGQIVPYTVIRDGAERVIPLKLERLSPRLVLARWSIPALSAVAMAVIATFVFLKKPYDRAARAMLMMGLAAMAQINTIDVLGVQLSEVVHRRTFLTFLCAELPGFAVFMGALVYFSLIFPIPKRFAARYPRAMLSLYLLPLVLTVTVSTLSGDTWTERLLVGTRFNNLVGLVSFIGAIASVVHSYRAARTATVRNQLRWVVWGSALPTIIWLALYAVPGLLLRHPLVPAGVSIIPFLLTAIAFAFSIVKYRLMDIDTVINRSLVYLTLTALLGGLYFLLVAILTRLLQLFGMTGGDGGTTFLSAILVAILFSPLRDRVQSLIDRAFYRDKLNFRLLLEDLSHELALTIVLSDLVPLLTKTVPARLNITHADLMITDRARERLDSVDEDFAIAQGSELAQYLLTLKRALLVALPGAEPDPLTEPLRARGIELCLPLIVGNKLVGLYTFGSKRSLEFYSREEIGVLTTLGNQAAISIENARLSKQVAEQERLKRELEIARQIQMGLLPQDNPQMEGFEIVGYSQPALEVGGDFYAYYPLPDGRLGIAVGDVSGKGLPGALYMAISTSVLEAHAPSYDRVGALLEVVNRTLHPRMQAQRMNTALAYVLLDPQRGEIQVSNAGLIAPVLLRCQETLRYLDPNNLPLGAMAAELYGENTVTLIEDDILILVSDGIIEAMNEDNELYGFNRFESLIRSCDENVRAQEIVDMVLADVQEFTGGAEQHDDMTMVVLRVQA